MARRMDGWKEVSTTVKRYASILVPQSPCFIEAAVFLQATQRVLGMQPTWDDLGSWFALENPVVHVGEP